METGAVSAVLDRVRNQVLSCALERGVVVRAVDRFAFETDNSQISGFYKAWTIADIQVELQVAAFKKVHSFESAHL